MPGALGIALMSFTETIAAGRAFALTTDPPISPNRELVAMAPPHRRGALRRDAGRQAEPPRPRRPLLGRQVAGHRSSPPPPALATMLFLAPVLGLLPNATLAAVVIFYSVGLIRLAEFRGILGVRAMEFRWALAACFGVLLFGTLKGILVAIIISMIGLASQTANPRVSVIVRKRGADVLRPVSDEHPDDETFEGLLIVRPEGRLFFLNIENVAAQVAALVNQYQPRVLVIDMSRVPDLEFTALEVLRESEKRAADRGAMLWVVGLNPAVLEMVRRSGLADRLGDRLLFNTRAAIARYQDLATGGR